MNYDSAKYLFSWVHKEKKSYEMPNHMHFLSLWRLSGSCLANHQGNWNPKVRELHGNSSSHHHWCEFYELQARAGGLFDLDKESVVVCQSWGLVCSWCLKSQPQFPFLLHTRRSTRDFRMCAKLSTYSVANNTFRVSEKVLHRLPIGRHHLVLNKHAYTLILAQTSLVIIYKTGAK